MIQIVSPGVLTLSSTSTISLSGSTFASGDVIKVVPSQLQIAGDLYVFSLFLPLSLPISLSAFLPLPSRLLYRYVFSILTLTLTLSIVMWMLPHLLSPAIW